LLTRKEYDPVPGYNPIDEINGTPYEPYASRYTYSQSPGETAQISQEIEQENKDAATADANGVFGYAMNILAGLIDRAGSVCLNSFALPLSGILLGLRSRCDVIWGATKGGRSPTGVALQMRGEAHAAALCGR
jgi:hypothetical protein